RQDDGRSREARRPDEAHPSLPVDAILVARAPQSLAHAAGGEAQEISPGEDVNGGLSRAFDEAELAKRRPPEWRPKEEPVGDAVREPPDLVVERDVEEK